MTMLRLAGAGGPVRLAAAAAATAVTLAFAMPGHSEEAGAGAGAGPRPEPAAGQGQGAPADPDAVRPFTIDVPDAVLADLEIRLGRTRLPDELPGTGWDYGTNRDYLEELLAYWRDGFDWRAQERMLNRFDQFKTTIDGLDVHFIHQRSPHEGALPLIITHGWPGSVMEFHKIIGPLTDSDRTRRRRVRRLPRRRAVHPGLRLFRTSRREPRLSTRRRWRAACSARLMARLGYERWGAQGGDWGSSISRWQAVHHPGSASSACPSEHGHRRAPPARRGRPGGGRAAGRACPDARAPGIRSPTSGATATCRGPSRSPSATG